MKIRYVNTIQDMVACSRYHFLHSPALRGQRIAIAVFTWALPLLTVAIPVLLAARVDPLENLVGIVFGALLVAPFFWLIPKSFAWSMETRVRRAYGEGTNKAIIGAHELELTESCLIERTAYNEDIRKLAAVERVVDTGDRAIIYLSAVSAHVIPRHAVSEGDYDKFVEAVAQRVAERYYGQRRPLE